MFLVKFNKDTDNECMSEQHKPSLYCYMARL